MTVHAGVGLISGLQGNVGVPYCSLTNPALRLTGQTDVNVYDGEQVNASAITASLRGMPGEVVPFTFGVA